MGVITSYSIHYTKLYETVPEVVRFGGYEDETSSLAKVQIAASHYLESWGDGFTYEGHYVPVQPLIEPLYETFGELEFLARIRITSYNVCYTKLLRYS